MYGFNIPIKMTGRFLEKNSTVNIKKSIDDFIELLAISPNGSFKADYNFGFIFQNRWFEKSDTSDRIDNKKIQGESYNRNNYAYELKLAIENYETRLKKVQVMMYHTSESKKVSLEITGIYEEDYTEKMYEKNITFYIW
jgi:hypothetical protein